MPKQGVLRLDAPLVETEVGHPAPAAGNEFQTGIVLGLAQLLQLRGAPARQSQFSAQEVMYPLAKQHREKLSRPFQLLAQLAGTGVGFTCSPRSLTLGRDQRPAKRDLQVEFVPPASRGVRQTGQQV